MDLTNLGTFITNVGFPIALCIGMIYVWFKNNKEERMEQKRHNEFMENTMSINMKEITDKQDKISNSQDKITESQEKISLALSNLNALISNKFDKYDARFISIEEDIGELKNIIKDN